MPFENDPKKRTQKEKENLDPITYEPGAHPVSTGVGAAIGGAVAGAGIGAVGGPIGAVAGIVGGAIVGGLAGKGAGEGVNPTEEESYWRATHSTQPYAETGAYEDYAGAYRTGWEGYASHGAAGSTFGESEPELQTAYERNRRESDLDWSDARPAAEAAWRKVSGNHERLISYDIEDNAGNKIGTVHNVWTDETRQPALIGVKTGWLGLGKNHVVPVHTARVNDSRKLLRIPFNAETIKNAPAFDSNADIHDLDEENIYSYYGLDRPQPLPGWKPVGSGLRLRRIIPAEIVQSPEKEKNDTTAVISAAGPQAIDAFTPLRREKAQPETKPSLTRPKSSKSGSKKEADTEGGELPRFPSEPGAKRQTPKRYEPKERGRER